MKRSAQDRLLKDALTGDGLSDFRQASLEQALNSIRQRRRQQRLIRFGALVALPLLGALLIFRPPKKHPGPLAAASLPPLPVATPSTPAQSSEVKFINDDELLALFPNRSVGLIGQPGHQQLVLLDQSPPAVPDRLKPAMPSVNREIQGELAP
jgi:hypothetical protein